MSMNASSEIKYRADIDGLRAISILSVFLYHLNPSWLPGGFVGVDVFYVISGYLITSIITLHDPEHKFSFLKFYQRRISRLFPSMILVVLCTWGATRFLYGAQDFASAGANGVAALLSVANIKYLFQGSYFEIASDAQPFLHFWSLSVEEQFYIFYPAALIAIAKFMKGKEAKVLLGVSVVSYAFCIVLTGYSEKAAFYILPTRAWELGIGGLISLSRPSIQSALSTRTRSWLAPAGIVMLALSFALLGDGLPFPGYVALLPVLGAAAILAATAQTDYPGYRQLAARPLAAIGKTS